MINRIEKYLADKPNLNEPKVLYRKWNEFFINADDDDDDDDEFEFNDNKAGFVALHAMPPFAQNVPDMDKLFNFWLVETNFGITKKMFSLVNNIEGVESIDKVSPYKVRISIGQLFDEKNVQNKISGMLKKCLENSRKVKN